MGSVGHDQDGKEQNVKQGPPACRGQGFYLVTVTTPFSSAGVLQLLLQGLPEEGSQDLYFNKHLL